MSEQQQSIQQQLFHKLDLHLERYPRVEGGMRNEDENNDFYRCIYHDDNLLAQLGKEKKVRYVKLSDPMPLKKGNIREYAFRNSAGRLLPPAIRFKKPDEHQDNPWPKKLPYDGTNSKFVYCVIPQILCRFLPTEFDKWLWKYRTRETTSARKLSPELMDEPWWAKRQFPEELGPGSWKQIAIAIYLPEYSGRKGMSIRGVKTSESFLDQHVDPVIIELLGDDEYTPIERENKIDAFNMPPERLKIFEEIANNAKKYL